MITWNNLPYGKYFAVETEAPSGYNKIVKPIPVEITQAAKAVTLNVENVRKGIIPSTGGMGTYLFTASGIGLMAAAVVMLRKRKAEQR